MLCTYKTTDDGRSALVAMWALTLLLRCSNYSMDWTGDWTGLGGLGGRPGYGGYGYGYPYRGDPARAGRAPDHLEL